MTVYDRRLEGQLNDILTTLGVTKTSLWPFAEKTGIVVSCIGPADVIPSETAAAAEALEDDFSPLALPCGLYSYHFNPTGDHHLAGPDHASYSFAAAAFSVGAWIRPVAINENAILAKYDSAGNKEEWKFGIDANGKLELELHDASASTTEIAISDDALTLNQWQFVVATYDGTAATPEVYLYVDGVAANDGSTTETGAFVDLEDTTAPLTIGCGGVTALPTTEFHGRIALPFICGKELTAAEVVILRDIMVPMVGLA